MAELYLVANKALEGSNLDAEEVDLLLTASTVEILDAGYNATDVVLIQNYAQQEKSRLDADPIQTLEEQRIAKLIKSILVEKLM